MDRNDYSEKDYREPHVPPSTPPAIDPHADAEEASTLAMDNGDSDYPGSHEASFDRTMEDDSINPGDHPDEVTPEQPDEVKPRKGDVIEPGKTGGEKAPSAPSPPEINLPPD